MITGKDVCGAISLACMTLCMQALAYATEALWLFDEAPPATTILFR